MSKTNGQARTRSARRRSVGVVDVPSVLSGNDTNTTSVGVAAREDLLRFANGQRFATILADPPWQFTNKTGKVAPEHKRLSRYGTMKLDEIMALPVDQIAATPAH